MPQTNDALVLLGKVDSALSPAHRLSTRYAYSWAEQVNGTFDVPTWTVKANGIERDSSHSIVGQINSVFGPALLNEAKVQYAREPRPRPYPGPDLPDTAIGNFPGGVDRSFRFGRPFFLPVDPATDTRFQVADSVTLIRGAHLLKAGGELNYTSMTQVFRGFARGRYIFTGGMPQFEAFINNPNDPGRLDLFRAVSAAGAARRPIDRRVGQPGHSRCGSRPFRAGQVEPPRPNLTHQRRACAGKATTRRRC